ncbi:uracil-DNA glycosylase family protein [Erythrobacter sp. 3-20A1M]|uniref:uracil-DNA glycosylase family protein n=1 Tax=Erythrobacter sp. 3-20A1M TaxID=2653850 RepID=UPI001BFC4E3A|nr:uracil-DNA glycosylase family protein [Erythrobacter sp. 3-20A1M]
MTDEAPPLSAREQIAAALAWWRDAGVAIDTGDAVTAWLDAETGGAADDASPDTKPRAAPKVPKPAPPPQGREAISRIATDPVVQAGGDPANWPTDLESFRTWWLEDRSIDRGGAYPRVAPRGAAGAELMVVVEQPEESDNDRLLSGPKGAFLDAILRAMAVGADAAYLAALLPRHTLHPDWEEIGRAGYAKLLAHHIDMVGPKRIICFGRNILSHIPHEPAQQADNTRIFNHDEGGIDLLPAGDFATLLQRKAARTRFWRNWLAWTDR